jgi:hypothetical protein
MAKIITERAYIEPFDENEDDWSVSLYIKENKKEILAGKVEMKPRSWIYLDYNEDGDLIINNSASMEDNKWDHITNELLRVEDIS